MTDDQKPDDPPDPPAPGEARMRVADARQSTVILRLAHSIGFTLMLNWDQMPTGLTKGLSQIQMSMAATARALAQQLASGLEHIPDDDPRIAEALEVSIEMIRDAFPQMRQLIKDHAAEIAAGTAGTPGDAPPADAPTMVKDGTPVVMVPTPKFLM